ncbi:MAG: preprotein translocase subunit SecA [Bacteroidetes bacterium]|nr:preprotein translocase subunit SecA [Bacteroidota bacterium]
MLQLIGKIFGNKYERDMKPLWPIVDEVNAAFQKLQGISNDELRAKSNEFKKRIQDYISNEKKEIADLKTQAEAEENIEVKESIYAKVDAFEKDIKKKVEEVLNEILPEAFAVMKETAKRFKENKFLEVTASDFDKNLSAKKNYVTISGEKAKWNNAWPVRGHEIPWDMVHYDVQLIGGTVLHQGKISEMATGEGKTLVATLPVYLNALAGYGVHIVTVNNYLARRDAEWNGVLFEFHGLSVDCIDNHEPNSQARRDAYLADITYGTNNEFGFDYLRDNMARSPEDLVQRGHHYAIVDEVDSVLIDDARTPLIISGPTPKGDDQLFAEMKPKVEKLINAQRTYINTILSDAKKLIADGKAGEKEGDGGLALLRAHRGLPKNKALIKYLSEQGMKAILQKVEGYYLQDQQKEMHKADAPLYFTIDEKNNQVDLCEKGIDLITSASDDSKFFVLPDVGAEIAEIEKSTSSEEEKRKKKEILMRDFAVKSERVHTITQLLKAYALFEKDVEYVVMDGKIKIVDEQTGRILEGRRYSDGLHQAIEAKENVKVEAATQTYATVTLQNYFRMYHKLAGMTGTAETEAGEFWKIYKLEVVVIPTNQPCIRKDEQDLVYKTAREKFNAVIEEVEKLVKAGRPALVGTTSVEISELLSRMMKMKGIKHNVLNAKMHQREAEIVAEAGHAGIVTIATNMAGRGTDIKLTPEVKQAGGLAIIGTERHESRRVDRQLRGRAGRQGDPGSSQFFVSLEDNLMRLFGSDRIARLMDRMGVEEGEVIQHSMVSKSIERAQKKVEENHFGTRKRLIEYDDVMNSQRDVIYTKRRHALFGERLSLDIANMLFDVSSAVVNEYHTAQDFEGMKFELFKVLSVETPFDEKEFFQKNPDELTHIIYELAYDGYKHKRDGISKQAFPVIKNVFENQGAQFENMVVPFSDGLKALQVVANLKKAYESQGKTIVADMEKNIMLAMIDDAWKEHLREMDELKTSVQNAVYEQKDPLLIYKFESFNLFKQMLVKMNKDIISFLVKATLPGGEQQQVKQASQQRMDTSKMKIGRGQGIDEARRTPQQNGDGNFANTQQEEKQQPVRVEKQIGRNDPCPCGSGKKYKNCHGK